MGWCWFQKARENSCALDEVLTFNQIDWEINFILVSCKGTSTWEAKWTQTGMRLHFRWKSNFCVQSALTQSRKCAACDILPSLTSLKKHGLELKFFVSIFGKLHQIKIWNRPEWQPSKFVRFFLTTICHTYRTIKPPWRAAINVFLIGLDFINSKGR